MLHNILDTLRDFSVDGMETMGPSQYLTAACAVQAPPPPRECMAILLDLCSLLMCNSQPLRVLAAQNLTVSIVHSCFGCDLTYDVVAQSYEAFLVYLRSYKIDHLNAKMQCRHYFTTDIDWINRGLEVSPYTTIVLACK